MPKSVPQAPDSSAEPRRQDEWYSDKALQKQAALAAWPEGTFPPLSMLVGLMEPRVQPAADEKCVCCGLDARDEAGGEQRPVGRYCSLCLGRGHRRRLPRFLFDHREPGRVVAETWGPTTTLYRLYDAGGRLLYLGITSSPSGRFTTHACEKVWWDEIVTIRLEHYETRKEALAAETEAVIAERPLHNLAGNPREDRTAGYRGWRVPRGICRYCGWSQALDATGRIRWHKSSDKDPVTDRITRYGTCPGARQHPAVSA